VAVPHHSRFPPGRPQDRSKESVVADSLAPDWQAGLHYNLGFDVTVAGSATLVSRKNPGSLLPSIFALELKKKKRLLGLVLTFLPTFLWSRCCTLLTQACYVGLRYYFSLFLCVDWSLHGRFRRMLFQLENAAPDGRISLMSRPTLTGTLLVGVLSGSGSWQGGP